MLFGKSKYFIYFRVFEEFCGQYNWTNVTIDYIRSKNLILVKTENNKLLNLCNQHQNIEIILNNSI
jgi:hypothetical protein